MKRQHSLYQCLLRHVDQAPREAVALFDILRNLRNTIHNAGRHVTKRGLEKPPLRYKGKDYHFIEGRLVGFYWNSLYDLIGDAIDVQMAIVTHPKLAGFTVVSDATNEEFRSIESGHRGPGIVG